MSKMSELSVLLGEIINTGSSLLKALTAVRELVASLEDKDNGYDPYEKKLLGITAMTSLLGKKKFEELLGALITKPQGKPTLVPASDKRPALNTAKDDFSEEE